MYMYSVYDLYTQSIKFYRKDVIYDEFVHGKCGKTLTVGGERFIADPRRSCGPMLLWRRMGKPTK